MFTLQRWISILIFTAILGTGCKPVDIQQPVANTNTPAPKVIVPSVMAPTVLPTPVMPEIPYDLISQESLLAYLEGLTSIQPYSGWRNSASSGEAEALDYVESKLNEFSNLQRLGMELERQSFPVFAATELRENRLYLTVGGREAEVAADAARGHRDDIVQALRFDSDGVLNDVEPDPVVVEGGVVVVRSESEIAQLTEADLQGAIVFVDYGVISPAPRPAEEGAAALARLVDGGAAGLVLVTDSSGGPEAQPGYRAGDGKVLENIVAAAAPPVLDVRLEDCAAAGITSWDDLAKIEAARLVWDADVSSPGASGNLVARIPGIDQSRAVILGAHIDSPNSPGALDNGANAAVLLEVARRLDEGGAQPPIDVYLVWFGSEELGIYGSLHFVDTHQELLDRAVGALLLDAFTAYIPEGHVALDGWSHSRFGDDRLTFARYLEGLAAAEGITVDEVSDIQSIASDNSVFSAFMPQAALAFGGPTSGYAHSPYDTWEAAAAQAEQIGRVAALALLATLETGRDLPDLQVTPEPDRRALIVSSHTQVAHLSGAILVDLARALAWEGFDVDTIPYGRAVTPEDLDGVGLVVALPVIDYLAQDDAPAGDEAWTAEEVDLLVDYVTGGGLLVLTDTAHRVMFGRVFEPNEDWDGANSLAEPFGVTFQGGDWQVSGAVVRGEHPLTQGSTTLHMLAGNGVPFTMADGVVLAEGAGQPAAGVVAYGGAGGEVLVLADVDMLGLARFVPPEEDNLGFLRNLAAYARDH